MQTILNVAQSITSYHKQGIMERLDIQRIQAINGSYIKAWLWVSDAETGMHKYEIFESGIFNCIEGKGF